MDDLVPHAAVVRGGENLTYDGLVIFGSNEREGLPQRGVCESRLAVHGRRSGLDAPRAVPGATALTGALVNGGWASSGWYRACVHAE